MTGVTAMLALVQWAEFLFLVPICLAIAIVTSAAHREDMRAILRHSMRAWVLLVVGNLVFIALVTHVFEWVLPG